MTSDLVVCGLGPAGRALAHRAAARGLAVTVVDPKPERRWTATYGVWADELPAWVAPETVAASVPRPVAWGTRRAEIERRYVVFDVAALQDSLSLTGCRVIAEPATDILRPRHGREHEAVRLASGQVLTARRVIDARGVGRSPARAEQTAYGVVVPRERWQEPLFMDWRPDTGTDPGAPPSFLYAIPLGPESFLLEETCLAGRPALSGAVLRARLRARLRCRGLELDGDETVEHVRFPVQGGRPGARRFGAAGALLHPATGYSVAASLATAEAVAAGGSIWPASARAVHRLRRAGLRALLGLPPADIPRFFDAFFDLPTELQRAYLSGRDDLTGTALAMTTLFRTLPWRLRRHLTAATLKASG
ncbi:lycopene cyclase family protein [Nocardia blacklockiae]|uniref:lycopene cyclase family protein n=1 Tax=Nocardia blacklockiae TaxID=480036 RepID=UPI0018937C7D|nr:lycopene cyclase family protein [Nocardia blacklockiae]MBF6170934.1 lycopene cyclase [Nocardia blacklockiae]